MLLPPERIAALYAPAASPDYVRCSTVEVVPQSAIAPSGLPQVDPTTAAVWGVLSTASAFASGIHGAKRHNGSWGWGLWWFACGAVFPVLTPAIAIGQGFGEPIGQWRSENDQTNVVL